MTNELRGCYLDGVKPYPKYLDWLRYACALLLYFYGISKLTGHQLVVPEWVAQKPIGSLDGFTLTWYYFGYSHAYKYILGSIQILAASLLLFRKAALIAAVLMVPVMANIVLINLFYGIAPGAEFMAFFIFGSMILLLWRERQAFFVVLWASQPAEPRSTNRRHWLVRSVILLYALGVVAVGTVAFSAFHRKADSLQQNHAAGR